MQHAVPDEAVRVFGWNQGSTYLLVGLGDGQLLTYALEPGADGVSLALAGEAEGAPRSPRRLSSLVRPAGRLSLPAARVASSSATHSSFTCVHSVRSTTSRLGSSGAVARVSCAPRPAASVGWSQPCSGSIGAPVELR